MKIVVDANIIMSAYIKPDSKIGQLLFSKKYDFYAPRFMLAELKTHQKKYLKYATTPNTIRAINKQITFVSDSEIPIELAKKSYKIMKDIDENDAPFLELSYHLNCKIWTGDKRFHEGLLKKGIKRTILTRLL
ncbi:MAG TPA: putative toxin-antitoxin system toxin component, PIN family [Chitinophagales bacterium]|nr:putative toxin-antitoxin system toxin component, PIN family [Chitinophagales bacterium]